MGYSLAAMVDSLLLSNFRGSIAAVMLQGTSVFASAGGSQCMTAFSNAEMQNLHFLADHNCATEIKRICDNSFTKDKSYDDFLKDCKKKDRNGNTPAMVAASGCNREALLALLAPFSMVEDCNEEDLKDLLHHENKNGKTLLSLIATQGQTLYIAHGIVIECEAIIHEWDSCSFKRCIRRTLGSTNSASRSLKMFEQMKRDEDANTFKAKAFIFMELMATIFVFRTALLGAEVGADIALLAQYYQQWTTESMVGGLSNIGNSSTDNENCKDIVSATKSHRIDTEKVPFEKYHCFMSGKTNFTWTAAVMCIPFLFFFFEQLRFRLFSRFIDTQFEEMSIPEDDPSNTKSLMLRLAKNTVKSLVNALCITLWPLMSIVRLFWGAFKFETARAEKKLGRRKYELDRAMMIRDRSHMVEICTEASLQPILQLYLVLLNLQNWIQSSQEQTSEETSDFLTQQLGHNQLALITVVISILNIGFGYTLHYYYQKDEALKIGPAILWFLTVMLFVISRILSFEIFAYSLGPGNFLKTLFLVGVHVLIMASVHFKFSDSLMHCHRKKGMYLKCYSNPGILNNLCHLEYELSFTTLF